LKTSTFSVWFICEYLTASTRTRWWVEVLCNQPTDIAQGSQCKQDGHAFCTFFVVIDFGLSSMIVPKLNCVQEGFAYGSSYFKNGLGFSFFPMPIP